MRGCVSGEPTHTYGMGARCIYDDWTMTITEDVESGDLGPDEVPNRTWYEVYWIGPRELHAMCDPFGISLRGVSADGCPIGECEE